MDPASPKKSRPGEAMGDVPQKPSRGLSLAKTLADCEINNIASADLAAFWHNSWPCFDSSTCSSGNAGSLLSRATKSAPRGSCITPTTRCLEAAPSKPVVIRKNLSLANCYFAHDSSGFPILLPFCDVRSARRSHPPLYMYRSLSDRSRLKSWVRAIVGPNGPKNDADAIEVVTANA
jgi:hypothetical protein